MVAHVAMPAQIAPPLLPHVAERLLRHRRARHRDESRVDRSLDSRSGNAEAVTYRHVPLKGECEHAVDRYTYSLEHQ
jgi:hypothetical protein